MSYSMLYHDGYDGYVTADLTTVYDEIVGAPTVTTGRNSGSALRIADAATDPRIGKLVGSYSEFVMGFALYPENNSSSVALELVQACEGGTQHLVLRMSNTAPHDLLIYRGTTLLTTVSAGLANTTWYHIQLAGYIHDTAGYWYLYVNNSLVGSGTSVDTRNGGTGVCDRVRLGITTAISNSAAYRIDDFYIASVTSGPEHPGDLREVVLFPTGAGNHTDFTPSAGSNWQTVDEASPNGDTDYNSSGTAGHRDSFTHTALPSNVGSVISVKQALYARKDDAGSRTAKQFVRIGGTNYDGATVNILDTYDEFVEMLNLSPATSSAWSPSEVDAMEIGYKVET